MRVLVTGGGGFLGGALVERLVACGEEVRSLQRRESARLRELGVEQVLGDVADGQVVERAAAGREVVFHAAARVDMWGPYGPFYRTNVLGTENVIAAARRNGVSRLILTSSPSVVHGRRGLAGADESTPYPDRFEAAYPQTKAMAEMAVLAANGPELATLALRPHLVWGPGDTNLVARLVERARAGRLRLVGGGTSLVDTTYVDNAVDAHLLAAERLAPRASCAGRAYFIANGEPRSVGEVVGAILGAAGLPPERRSLPLRLALALGRACELVDAVVPFRGGPPMTRFIARSLATAHWYDLGAARRDLGFEPRVSFDDGIGRLAAWFRSNS
ncbi:MAG: NAD-dependent epimerase/dehydratase family protein [Thermoanaerobaculales bacterium]|nr:NAD-dependent epimerase/dehydratase family protein [Thermoanaerobaculales bacterium]